jgi:hypothetical protein
VLAADVSSDTAAVDLIAHQHSTHTGTGYEAFDVRFVLASGSGTAVVFKITSVAEHFAVALYNIKAFKHVLPCVKRKPRLQLHGHGSDAIVHITQYIIHTHQK